MKFILKVLGWYSAFIITLGCLYELVMILTGKPPIVPTNEERLFGLFGVLIPLTFYLWLIIFQKEKTNK